MPPTFLNLYHLQLWVFLGVPDAERSALQAVDLDIQIQFSKQPLGCQTDCIKDTVCYAALVEKLEKNFGHHTFHLIEYLGSQVYQEIQKTLGSEAQIALKLRKTPPLSQLKISEFCIGRWK